MQTARIFTPPNRLARALRADGPFPDQLIADADERIAALASDIRVFVFARIAQIALYADRSEDQLFGGCKDIRAPAMDIAEVAAAAGLHGVAGIARGICFMLDGLVTQGVWHTEAMRIHLRALRLVGARKAPAGDEDQKIVTDLLELRQSIGLAE